MSIPGVLIDRLWPRGLSKKRAAVDEWLRELAPSTALRRRFGHEAARWADFKRRYFQELKAEAAAAAVAGLQKSVASGQVASQESVVVLVTGNGLKDVASAMKAVGKPTTIDPDIAAVRALFPTSRLR